MKTATTCGCVTDSSATKRASLNIAHCFAGRRRIELADDCGRARRACRRTQRAARQTDRHRLGGVSERRTLHRYAANSKAIAGLNLGTDLRRLGDDGFLIRPATVAGHKTIVIAGNTDVGALYGAFRFLRAIQTIAAITTLSIADAPRIKLRMLDRWDNLDRSVERGYAGRSL
jgi:hypothetical protein